MAGQGLRLQKALGLKKQFFPLKNGKEMFLLALEPFLKDASFQSVFLVIAKEDKDIVSAILKREGLEKRCVISYGGASREESVFNGLKSIRSCLSPEEYNNAFVFIHDSDRPFLSTDLLNFLKGEVNKEQGAIPGMKISQSLFNLKKQSYENRDDFLYVQTPQAFFLPKVFQAFSAHEKDLASYTDEGMIFLASGEKVSFIPGSEENIKISDLATLRQAIIIAEGK